MNLQFNVCNLVQRSPSLMRGVQPKKKEKKQMQEESYQCMFKCITWGSQKKTMTTKLGVRGDNGLHQGQERWTCSGPRQSWPMRLVWDRCYQVEFFSGIVMSIGCSQHLRNGPTCKDKWSSILGEFKRFLSTCFVLGRMRIINHWACKIRLPFICPS